MDITVVVDNGSSDNTRAMALNAGAVVVDQPVRGYGYACQVGIDYLKENGIDIVVFMDGDFSDYPEELPIVVKPIIDEDYDKS